MITFNVRFDSVEDGVHDWRHRRADVLESIRAHDPDLISLQEPDASQWADISTHLAGYAPFGLFDDGSESLEAHGGFFRASRFDSSRHGIVWLSDTPSIPHSVTWENDWEPRACGWIQLLDRVTDRPLLFASTHFDTNARGWLRSAKTLRRELDTIAGTTSVIVAGDFNCRAGSEAHRYLIAEGGFRDVWYEAGHSDAGVLTFHGFTGRRQLPTVDNERIDWILVRGDLTCVEAKIDYTSKSGQPASDHYPVIAELDWCDLRPSTFAKPQSPNDSEPETFSKRRAVGSAFRRIEPAEAGSHGVLKTSVIGLESAALPLARLDPTFFSRRCAGTRFSM